MSRVLEAPPADLDLDRLLATPAVERLFGRSLEPVVEWRDLVPGGRIDCYRVVRELGRGGMAQVVLAVRDDEVCERTVALKVLRPGLDHRQIARRFLDERRILAQLNHPHIARLYDGGTTPDGRPYFVMEAVDGRSIDRHCAALDLDLEARLDLFEPICAAVAYAHRNLVVHRDLKPSNILVASDGSAKLLDFGIAKMLAPSAGGDATRTVLRAMTPGYASPEQRSGGRITTATDVYSLGVTLYELLTGERPFDDDALESDDLRDRGPRPASSRPGFVRGSPRHGAELGDLDSILAKALRTEPEQRYASVDALLGDLTRWRAGLPVAARADSLKYRLWKLARRHRTKLVAATFAALTAAALLVAHHRATALHAERLADERRRSDEAVEFLVSLFESEGERKLSADELLDRGSRELESRGSALGDRPEGGLLHATVGRAFLGQSRPRAARRHLLRALGARGPEDAVGDLAQRDLIERAELYRLLAAASRQEGRFRRGESEARRALALYARSAPEAGTIGRVDRLLGWLLREQGRHVEAREVFERAAARQRRELGVDHPATVEAEVDLASLELEHRDVEAAEVRLEAALERLEGRPEARTERARVLTGLGLVAAGRGRGEEAHGYLLEALRLHRSTLGEEHRLVANVMSLIADFHGASGAHLEAIDLQHRVVDLETRLVGPHHLRTLEARADLARHHAVHGDWSAALEVLQAVSIDGAEHLGSGHPRVALWRVWTAEGHHALGDLATAVPLYRSGLAVLEETWPASSPRLLHARRKAEEARAALAAERSTPPSAPTARRPADRRGVSAAPR